MPLSITVQPNELFPASEAVTLAKLRNAAKPSVAISGSVGSDDLAANSVTGTNIAASAITANDVREEGSPVLAMPTTYASTMATPGAITTS